MGKKGKRKKEKITGTPDVVKFKNQREFAALKEAVSTQEAIPFLASDHLEDVHWKRVSRMLNLVGVLSEYVNSCGAKDYRFRLHHKYLHPAPQYFPSGYCVDTAIAARDVRDRPGVAFNAKEYAYSEPLVKKADDLLKWLDYFFTFVADTIERALKADFANGGLKSFFSALRTELVKHDAEWSTFEQAYLAEMLAIHTEMFAPVDRLVHLESRLTTAEEIGEMVEKQTLEHELVSTLEEFVNVLYPPTADAGVFPDDVVPLAESAIFYATKLNAEEVNLAKHLIKAYLELRIHITNIPCARLLPQMHDNKKFCRLLKSFHASVLDALEVLEKSAKLPQLLDSKTDGWLTKKLLEPELALLADAR